MNMDILEETLNDLSTNVAVMNDRISGKDGVIDKQDEVQRAIRFFGKKLNNHITDGEGCFYLKDKKDKKDKKDFSIKQMTLVLSALYICFRVLDYIPGIINYVRIVIR